MTNTMQECSVPSSAPRASPTLPSTVSPCAVMSCLTWLGQPLHGISQMFWIVYLCILSFNYMLFVPITFFFFQKLYHAIHGHRVGRNVDDLVLKPCWGKSETQPLIRDLQPVRRSSTADPPRWPLESQPTRRPQSSRRPSTLNFLAPLLTATSMASLWFGDPGGGITLWINRSVVLQGMTLFDRNMFRRALNIGE